MICLLVVVFKINYFSVHGLGVQARIEALAAKLAKEAPAPRGSGRGGQRAIVHIDMDCFFASVAGTQLQCVCLELGFCSDAARAEFSASCAHHHGLLMIRVE